MVLPNPAGDQLIVLGAEIDDDDHILGSILCR
jgi:hypothetical protein